MAIPPKSRSLMMSLKLRSMLIVGAPNCAKSPDSPAIQK
jgi:hypothetical protein